MKHRNLIFAFVVAIFLIVSGCASTTPLIKASKEGDSLAVQKLIDAGVNINEPDSKGMTPLMHAIQYQNKEAVDTLIKKGADVNIKDKYGYTALYYAVIYSNLKIVKLLIENGANINAQDSLGATALHSFVQTYNDENALMIAEYLLSKNADTTVKDKNGWTVLENAIYYRNIDMVALIRKNTGWKQEIESSTFGDAFDEALKNPSSYKPAKDMYDVPADKEHVYKKAIIDCNLIIIPNRRGLLLATAGVGYVVGLAVDSVTIKGKFQSCMAKMGFECKNNCSK
jgi:hypothetical protein